MGARSDQDHEQETDYFNLPTDSDGRLDRFLFHGGGGVADGEALLKVIAQESFDAPETLVLGGVDEFVNDHAAAPPEFGADEDAVAEAEASRVWREGGSVRGGVVCER